MTPSLHSRISAVTIASALAVAQSDAAAKASHAPFGTITSKPGECVVGDPDTYISPEDLQWIWDNRLKHDATTYNNWIIDDLVANNGTINYCVRWDSSTTKLTKEVAAKLEPMLARQHAAWNRWLIGYDCWPFDEIKVKVVGFAAKDASILDWDDDSLGKIYIGDLDEKGSPQCPHKCYRAVDEFLNGWSDEELEIVSHEMGHGFALPDFYQEAKPANFKPCLMDATTSSTVRDTDGWMLRRVLEYKKRNYNF